LYCKISRPTTTFGQNHHHLLHRYQILIHHHLPGLISQLPFPRSVRNQLTVESVEVAAPAFKAPRAP
jgi:hypothetical protein